MNRRASCVGTFEVFEAAHVALRTLLAFSQPVNCIFWPIGMLNWLVAASKLHKYRETCCTAEWPLFISYSMLMFITHHRISGAVHMSWASLANRADLIVSPLRGLKYSGELTLEGIAVLSDMKAYHQAKTLCC